MISRRGLLAGAASVIAALKASAAKAAGFWLLAAPGAATPPASFQWDQVLIGGGGLTSGLSIHSDGTRICKTDGAGFYKWNPTGGPGGFGVWTYMPTNTAMPVAYTGINPNSDQGMGTGVYEFVLAPSNSSRHWVAYLNEVFTSTNGGTSYTSTGFRAFVGFNLPFGSGGLGWNSGFAGDTRFYQRKMDVDPNNEQVCFLGSATDSLGTGTGVYYTLDGGSTWNRVSNANIPIPIANAGGSSSHGTYLISFDPNSSVSGGFTQGIYVFSFGNGLYHSTNGGSSFTGPLGSGGPITARCLLCDGRGRVWVGDSTANPRHGWLWDGSTWTQSVTSADLISGVAVKLGASSGLDTIVFSDGKGVIHWSTNGGTSFSNSGSLTFAAGAHDVPWLPTPPGFQTASAIAYDPITTRWYVACGIGVFYTASLASPTNYVFETRGIEDLDEWWSITPPGGSLIVTVEDRSSFTLPKPPNVYPSVYNPSGPFTSGDITWGFDTAYDPTNTSKITLITEDTQVLTNQYSGYSTDGGVTWNSFGAYPFTDSVTGGCMALVGNVIFWSPPSKGFPAYVSSNNGSSWSRAVVGSIPSTAATGTTNAATSAGSKVLNFASVPAGVVVGGYVTDTTTSGVIPANTTVASFTTTTVTLSANVTGAGVGSGDSITFDLTDYGWQIASTNPQHTATVDASGNFYCANAGLNASDTTLSGVYYSPTGLNSSWSQIKQGFFTGNRLADHTHPRLLAVYNQTGHLWWCPGPQVGGSAFRCLTANNTGLQTWSQLPNFSQVFAIGFGKSATGGSYPSMYVSGIRTSAASDGGNGYGIYRCDNADNATIANLTFKTIAAGGIMQWPLDRSYTPISLCGDPDNAGWCYVGMTNNGFAYWHN